MTLLMLLGYLMCNVLLAWATLQQPYISKTLSSPPPRNPNKWTHSIIFEPQQQIQLTHSSYKVTSFLDFQPFLQGFQNVKNYLDHLWEDIFHETYRKFLVAIDHLEYHPSQVPTNATRLKRSVIYETYGYYNSLTKMLTPSKENFLNAFMEALFKINLSLHKNLSHMKRVGIFTWILGWGVYSNAKNIAKIKENVHTLQKQNQLQDKQIKQLANFLNLTMHQVDRHNEMLYELDTKMTIMNKTI